MEKYIRHQKWSLLKLPVLSHHDGSEWDMYPMQLQIKLNEHHVHMWLAIHEHRQDDQLSTAPASAVLGNSPATHQCLVPI